MARSLEVVTILCLRWDQQLGHLLDSWSQSLLYVTAGVVNVAKGEKLLRLFTDRYALYICAGVSNWVSGTPPVCMVCAATVAGAHTCRLGRPPGDLAAKLYCTLERRVSQSRRHGLSVQVIVTVRHDSQSCPVPILLPSFSRLPANDEGAVVNYTARTNTIRP